MNELLTRIVGPQRCAELLAQVDRLHPDAQQAVTATVGDSVNPLDGATLALLDGLTGAAGRPSRAPVPEYRRGQHRTRGPRFVLRVHHPRCATQRQARPHLRHRQRSKHLFRMTSHRVVSRSGSRTRFTKTE